MSKQTFLRVGKLAFDATLFCLVIGVIAQNRVLVSKLKAQEEAIPGTTIGRQVRNLSGVTLDGAIKPIALPEAGRKLLIIGMSPRDCPDRR